MKYTLVIFALLFVAHSLFAQTEPLEGKKNAMELEKEIEEKKGTSPIRSYSSANTETPLCIIEGEIVKVGELDDIDPNMIKGIEILKDEKATAIYGEKGKNGVIIITLKKKYAKKFKKERKEK